MLFTTSSSDREPRTNCIPYVELSDPKVPGTKCPTCALAGREVWVIPGRSCGYCGTPCDEPYILLEYRAQLLHRTNQAQTSIQDQLGLMHHIMEKLY